MTEPTKEASGDPERGVDPGADGSVPPPPAKGRERGWLRAAGLFAVALSLSALEPSVLVGVPFAFFVLAFPARRLATLLVGSLAVLLVFGGGAREGLWYAERGWAILTAGWFVALTVRWPASSFSERALGAVGGTAAVVAALLAVQPGSWGVVDWLVSERMMEGVATFLEALRLLRGEAGAVSSALVATVYRTAEIQALVFPALLGLASMAALGVAWWLYVRLALGDDRALGPLKEFRFNDQLVWLFVGGLVLVALGRSGGWARAGSNAAVFMGALYALRGAAVVLFFNGGLSLLGFVLLGVGLLFAWPVIGVGALVIGLGDTWLDLRERARELMA